MTFLAGLSLAIWVFLLAGHGRFWESGPILPPARPATCPAVDIIVPARDEAASIRRCLVSLLAQDYPDMRVILVDDGSTDGTGEIARALADPRLIVLTGTPRPPGWAGKLWALSQGIAQARAPILLLTDADIEHHPAHLATLVAKMQADRLDMVSEMVALNCESLAERALVPAFVFFFQLLYPFEQVNDPGSPVAAAAGGTVLITAKALARAGGIAAMHDALIDDVTLAGRVKKTGRIFLGHSKLAASIRPYPGVADIWRMIARSAYVQLRRSPWILAGTVLGMVMVWLAPPGAALFGHGAARVAGALAWLALALSYVPTLRRFGQSALWAPALPLVALFYTAATLGSAADHYRGRGAVWKQRAYGDGEGLA